tara:strand:- start:2293 stop:3585 length:1293 start_codon:yes stop_codon:yes gene_type:complete
MGLWHLGSVTASSLASIGFNVIGYDADERLIDSLNEGKSPVFEKSLDDTIKQGIKDKRLIFTSDLKKATSNIDYLWITYDTPVDESDEADHEYVKNKIKDCFQYIKDGLIIVISSQLPVGSTGELKTFARENYLDKEIHFSYIPENLRLGNALENFLNPDRLVVGCNNSALKEKLNKMLIRITENIEWMSIESAEMTKHAINSFLATSITFANEIASICEIVGADAKEVERGLKTESRIGKKAYLSPGGPFSGGTLARDVNFLTKISNSENLLTPTLSSIALSNNQHKNWTKIQLVKIFSSLKNVKISIWGLIYKSGTDTLRRSLFVELCDWLISEGAEVNIYDPMVSELPDNLKDRVNKINIPANSIHKIDVLIIGTSNQQFIEDFKNSSSNIDSKLIIVDANRLLYPILKDMELQYISVGLNSIKNYE